MTLTINILVLISLSAIVQVTADDFSDAVLDANGQRINCGIVMWRKNCPADSWYKQKLNFLFTYCAKTQIPPDAILNEANVIRCGKDCDELNALCKINFSLYPTSYCAHHNASQ